MRVAKPVTVTQEQRNTLIGWSRGRSTPARVVQRAKIILLAVEGQRNKQIASEVGTDRLTVARWRTRFASGGLAGIAKDAPRGGRPATKRTEVAHVIVQKTTQERPPNATHWSTRTLGRSLGVSHSMVHRVWRANQLKPHLSRTFKISNDPQFAGKLLDVVGLYLNPPEHALVLCTDEKSQIQALDRTPPSLPMYPGRCGTLTHDYKRHGTTTLFAALDMAEGRLIGTCLPRHRHHEWMKFLRLIDEQTPADLALHLIVDNYSTHKHPRVKAWLKRHPRFHIHFTPTSSSGLNLVERWFRELTVKRIRRGTFLSVPELIEAITQYIDHNNKNPKPFVWTAKAEHILSKIQRARAVLDKLSSE